MERLNNDWIIEQNKALNEAAFELVGDQYKDDIQGIFNKLMRVGLDDITDGFWVWHIEKNTELYSPTFRTRLQYIGESDFPNVPQSWMDDIEEKSKIEAFDNYHKHVESEGKHPYIQKVTYNRKHNGKIDVICHGKVVYWKDGKPIVMVGVHMKPDGLYSAK